jgi:hypothetical protein
MMNPVGNEERLTTADIANPVNRNGDDAGRADVRGPELDGRDRNRPASQDVEAIPSDTRQSATVNQSGPLFPQGELHDFRAQWDKVQTSFVDEPRAAVEEADSLVATVVRRIAQQFAEGRAQLEQEWSRGDDVSTEDLRQALRRYRAFFDRLLSV